MAEQNLTKMVDIKVTPRSVDFVSQFAKDFESLDAIMGIQHMIPKAPGTKLTTKYAKVKLHDGEVAEGDIIPYSHAEVVEREYGTLTIKPYRKGVSLQAINEYGYDTAVNMTDTALKNEVITEITNGLYEHLNQGELTNVATSWIEALAMAKGRCLNKFKQMNLTATGVVGFANILDLYEYLGQSASNYGMQLATMFGFEYVKNWFGYDTVVFLPDEQIRRGRVIATPVGNPVCYYAVPSHNDFRKAGFNFVTDTVLPLIGFATEGKYENITSDAVVIYGIKSFVEYPEGIAVIDVANVPKPTVPASDATFLNKTASELQSNVKIQDNEISGTLNYVTEYTDFSGLEEEQSGHYLAFTVETNRLNSETIYVQLLDSRHKNPVPLDESGEVVVRLTDTATQKLKVMNESGAGITYDLSKLVLAEQ